MHLNAYEYLVTKIRFYRINPQQKNYPFIAKKKINKIRKKTEVKKEIRNKGRTQGTERKAEQTEERERKYKKKSTDNKETY